MQSLKFRSKNHFENPMTNAMFEQIDEYAFESGEQYKEFPIEDKPVKLDLVLKFVTSASDVKPFQKKSK